MAPPSQRTKIGLENPASGDRKAPDSARVDFEMSPDLIVEIEETQAQAFEEGVKEGYMELKEDAEPAIRNVFRSMKRSGRILTNVSTKTFVGKVMGVIGEWLGNGSGSEEDEDGGCDDDASGAGLHETFLPEARDIAATSRESVERHPVHEVPVVENPPEALTTLISEEEATKLVRLATEKAQNAVFSVLKRQADKLLLLGRDDVDAAEFIALVEREIRSAPSEEFTHGSLTQLGEGLEQRRMRPSGWKQTLESGQDAVEQPHASPKRPPEDATTAAEAENGEGRLAKAHGTTIFAATGVSGDAQDAMNHTKHDAGSHPDHDSDDKDLADDSPTPSKAISATTQGLPMTQPTDSINLQDALHLVQEPEPFQGRPQPVQHPTSQKTTTTTDLSTLLADASPSNYESGVQATIPSPQSQSTRAASPSASHTAVVEAGESPLQNIRRAPCRMVESTAALAPVKTDDNTASSSSAGDETLGTRITELDGSDETATVAEQEVPSTSESPLTKLKRQRDDSASPGGDKKRLSQERED